MLKSLLAGLSLPSRDGRADRGLDEEGEGEWGRGCGLDCPGRPSGIVGPGSVTRAKHRVVLWPARPTAPALCGTNQAPLFSVPVPTLGPLQWGDPPPAASCLAGMRWICEWAECPGAQVRCWPFTAILPWFCQVAGVECDSWPSTDAPSTVLCTQAPLLSTCCVPGAAGKATRSVVGERLEREVPRLPGSSQQARCFSTFIECPLCTRHRAQPRAGAAPLGVWCDSGRCSARLPLAYAHGSHGLGVECVRGSRALWTVAWGGPSSSPTDSTGLLSCRRELGWPPASGQHLPLHPSDRS